MIIFIVRDFANLLTPVEIVKFLSYTWLFSLIFSVHLFHLEEIKVCGRSKQATLQHFFHFFAEGARLVQLF